MDVSPVACVGLIDEISNEGVCANDVVTAIRRTTTATRIGHLDTERELCSRDTCELSCVANYRDQHWSLDHTTNEKKLHKSARFCLTRTLLRSRVRVLRAP